MKLKITKEFSYCLLLAFPLVNMIYNTLLGDFHYSTFSIGYFLVTILSLLSSDKYLLTKKFLIIIFIASMYCLLGYEKSGSIVIQFFLFAIFADFYSNKKLLHRLNNYIEEKNTLLFCIYVLYFSVLLYSVLFKEGMKSGWGTAVLYGPYTLSHSLAYELLTVVTASLLVYKKTILKRWVAVALLAEILIVLTCVRSAFLSSAFVWLWFIFGLKVRKKLIFLAFGSVVLSVLFYYNVFDQIIEKTLFAASNGSVTNGREWIVESGKQIFIESSFLEKVIGSGYYNLLEGNLHHLGLAIQGHNDFITVLISFGFFGLLIFVSKMCAYLKGRGWIGCFLALFVLVYYNGLFLYVPIVIELYMIRLFFLEYGQQALTKNKI